MLENTNSAITSYNPDTPCGIDPANQLPYQLNSNGACISSTYYRS